MTAEPDYGTPPQRLGVARRATRDTQWVGDENAPLDVPILGGLAVGAPTCF